ncbi:hypothetical protein [Streptomyces sp. NPDC006879]|uniref:hypothetical protein n=1 Tax=Streptomyces sp. NPDC006879 TaxID=3364767 RepID=UPI0036B88464
MPLITEESQIHESAQGPRVAPAASRTAPTPRPVPGPRPVAVPRPGRPGPTPRPAPPVQRAPHEPAGSGATQSPTSAAPMAAPQIQLIPATAEGALDAAEEAVDLLLESGRAPGDVLVLTSGDPHPWAAHELTFGESAYWAQHDARDDVFYADAGLAGRASARPVVVFAANGADAATAARELPKALGCAQTLLIVCGDPQQINSVLGAGV